MEADSDRLELQKRRYCKGHSRTDRVTVKATDGRRNGHASTQRNVLRTLPLRSVDRHLMYPWFASVASILAITIRIRISVFVFVILKAGSFAALPALRAAGRGVAQGSHQSGFAAGGAHRIDDNSARPAGRDPGRLTRAVSRELRHGLAARLTSCLQSDQ